MQCHHFDAGRCGSCSLLPIPHTQQVSDARTRIEQLLAPFTAQPSGTGGPGPVWGPPLRSAESGFRNRAKMVVSGTAADPTLGLLPGSAGAPGADLVDCPLYPPGMEPLLEGVRDLIRRAQVPPYDVARRRGELKHVLATISPDGEVLLRLVLRTDNALPRIREHLPRLLSDHPEIRVVTANLHPEHKATLEGHEEIHLAGAASLPVRTGAVTLRARPQSFLQTNTDVASQLYLQVKEWVDGLAPATVWDLYCGVGGFALHAAQPVRTAASAPPPRAVTGVEVSPQAVAAAEEAAAAEGLAAQFHAADATSWAEQEARSVGPPDLLIVNPPRRGIGERLAAWIEQSGIGRVIYSSCNPDTLAADLARMPSYRIVRGRYVDMFPHTRHAEVLTLLERGTPDRMAA